MIKTLSEHRQEIDPRKLTKTTPFKDIVIPSTFLEYEDVLEKSEVPESWEPLAVKLYAYKRNFFEKTGTFT